MKARVVIYIILVLIAASCQSNRLTRSEKN
jgi:hypothetical protein